MSSTVVSLDLRHCSRLSWLAYNDRILDEPVPCVALYLQRVAKSRNGDIFRKGLEKISLGSSLI